MKSIVTALLGAVLPLAAWSQAYPSVKPIRLIVPFAPGGNVDITARTIAPGLGEAIGQTVVVENRTGAGGVLGADAVAKSPADGYTLLMGSNSSVSVAPALNPKNPYHPIRDFAPISLVAATPFVLVAHPSVPANTLGELIALAKAKPGSLTMASGGIGSSNHLVGELFQSVTRTKLLHIPYKGAGAVAGDLMGGQVQLLFDQLAASTPNIKSGKLKAFAVTSATRASVLPEVPTMVESGLKEMDVINITGLLAPIGTSPEIVARLNAALLKVLARTEVKERFATLGVSPLGSTPEQFATFIRDDYAKWTKVITDANIKAE
jgi:tripartite-type tricarboxylate transporter receptor subunit TctC